MAMEGLNGILGLVSVGLEEEEEPLLIKVLSVVFDLVLGHVFMEFVDFFSFVVVVFDLSIVEEATSLFALFCFLLFF
jgi:hypothetical protein